MSEDLLQKRNFLSNQQFKYIQKDSNISNFQFNSSSSNSPMEFIIAETKAVQASTKIKQKTKRQINNFTPDMNAIAKIDNQLDPSKSIDLAALLKSQLSNYFQQVSQNFKDKEMKQRSKNGIIFMKTKLLKRFNEIIQQREQNLQLKNVIFQYDKTGIWEFFKNKFLQILLKEQLNEFQVKINFQIQERQITKQKKDFLVHKLIQNAYHIHENFSVNSLSQILNIENLDIEDAIRSRQKQEKNIMRSTLKNHADTTKYIKTLKKHLRLQTISENVVSDKQFAKAQGVKRSLFKSETPFKIKENLKELQLQRKTLF